MFCTAGKTLFREGSRKCAQFNFQVDSTKISSCLKNSALFTQLSTTDMPTRSALCRPLTTVYERESTPGSQNSELSRKTTWIDKLASLDQSSDAWSPDIH